MAAKNLGELLVRESLINMQQLDEARREQKNYGGRLGSALVKLGHIDERKLAEFMGQQYQVPSIDLNSFEIDPEAIKAVTREVCLKYCVIPVSKSGNVLVVAFADPSNVFARDDLTFLSKCKIEQVVATEPSILTAIERYYVNQRRDFGQIVTEMERTDDAFLQNQMQALDLSNVKIDTEDSPVVKFVNLLLTEAIENKASDIHIEPYEKRTRVRFRIDGRLREKIQPPVGLANAIAARVKVMAKLDIAERRRPQDGRLKVHTSKGDVDFRVSVLPTLYGEKVVLRLLDKTNLQLDMTKLGFQDDDMEKFKKAIKLPQGMVLITGPTGSGKTTTIYSALAELNQTDKNISTAEDPVEFNLDGINQVQINHEIEFGFAEALRSFLRQDPNVIMVGEIRDLETAEIAFKAASTGHLVVSTLHTNDAPSTIVRLLDMGIANFLIAASVNLIVAQRLVQKICEYCKTPNPLDTKVLTDLGVPLDQVASYKVMRGDGCNKCNGTGMKGRIAIYEILEMTNPIRDAILKSVSPRELRQVAVAQGMRTLRHSALLALRDGLTSIEQVLTTTIGD